MVSIIAAMTACGRIGPGFKGSYKDRMRLEDARERTHASIIGAATLRHGEVEMRGKDGRFIPGRMRCIVTASGELPVSERRIFHRGPTPYVFTTSKGAMALGRHKGLHAHVVEVEEGPFGCSLFSVISYLHGLGARDILIEGGARLNYAAIKEGVVDELLLTLSPCLIGLEGAPTLADGPLALGDLCKGLSLLESDWDMETGDVFLRYSLK